MALLRSFFFIHNHVDNGHKCKVNFIFKHSEFRDLAEISAFIVKVTMFFQLLQIVSMNF